MASLRFKPVVALLVTGAMIVSSTSAVAAGTGAPSGQQIDPWAALSVLSAGAPAAALCGAAAAAAQAGGAGCVLPAVDAPPPVAQIGPPPPTPVPPVEPASEGLGLGVSPLWLALGAIAIGAAAYFLLRNKHSHATSPA